MTDEDSQDTWRLVRPKDKKLVKCLVSSDYSTPPPSFPHSTSSFPWISSSSSILRAPSPRSGDSAGASSYTETKFETDIGDWAIEGIPWSCTTCPRIQIHFCAQRLNLPLLTPVKVTEEGEMNALSIAMGPLSPPRTPWRTGTSTSDVHTKTKAKTEMERRR